MSKPKVKISKKDIGRWLTIKWDDVGREDVLMTDYNPEYKHISVFSLTGGPQTIDKSQILEKRGFIKAA